MGCYYLTMSVPEAQGRRHDLQLDRTRSRLAYAAGKVGTHARIKVRLPKDRCMREELDKKGSLRQA